jgi:hypothetical protein
MPKTHGFGLQVTPPLRLEGDAGEMPYRACLVGEEGMRFVAHSQYYGDGYLRLDFAQDLTI